MNGFIVKQPYANMIINEEKTWELRNRIPPRHHINKNIFLLSKGYILGIIRILDYKKISIDELKNTNHLHGSGIYWSELTPDTYAWIIHVVEKYENPVKYNHPNGAQIWVLNVKR